jgi:DNA-binding transcriptional ArsR family regulator
VDPETLAACKTLMDRDRLRVVGALAGSAASVEELASSLNLPARAITRHIGRLRDAGIVAHPTNSDGARYSLHLGRLAAIAAELARFERSQQPLTSDLPTNRGEGSGLEWSREEAKVLRAFFEDGRLTSIPAQHAKRVVVLKYLAATVFVPGEEYAEKDVNMRLALRHPDVAALRRYLVDEKFMERSAGIYRLTGTPEN